MFFDKKNVFDEAFNPKIAPDPYGLSGGLCIAVRLDAFYLKVLEKRGNLGIQDFIETIMSSNSSCICCAVLTNWNQRKRRMTGTKLNQIYEWYSRCC